MNPAQLYEISVNFICSRVIKKIREFKLLKDKEKLLFDIIKRFNKEQHKSLKEYYSELKLKEKREFFEDVINDGIYIKLPVFWEDEYIFNVIRQIYKDYDWIKPVDLYIQKWGRRIKIMKPLVYGELYMIKLKQSSKKGFSARSTGSISRKGVPEKSIRNKLHQDLYSTTPIRIGDQENVNALIGVEADIVAKLHMHYRSSIIGRRKLGKKLATTMGKLNDFSHDKRIKNRNVEILQAYLKSMGYRIEFMGQKYEIHVPNDRLWDYNTEDGLMICTEDEYNDYKLKKSISHKYENDVCLVGTMDEYEEALEKEYKRLKDKEKYYVIDIDV